MERKGHLVELRIHGAMAFRKRQGNERKGCEVPAPSRSARQVSSSFGAMYGSWRVTGLRETEQKVGSRRGEVHEESIRGPWLDLFDRRCNLSRCARRSCLPGTRTSSSDLWRRSCFQKRVPPRFSLLL